MSIRLLSSHLFIVSAFLSLSRCHSFPRVSIAGLDYAASGLLFAYQLVLCFAINIVLQRQQRQQQQPRSYVLLTRCADPSFLQRSSTTGLMPPAPAALVAITLIPSKLRSAFVGRSSRSCVREEQQVMGNRQTGCSGRKTSLRQKLEDMYARRLSSKSEEETIVHRKATHPGQEADQWIESIRVMTRMSGGVPPNLRKKVRLGERGWQC